MKTSRWYDNSYSDHSLKWIVHQSGDEWWCAHRAARPKDREDFTTWRDAYTYAYTRFTMDKLRRVVE